MKMGSGSIIEKVCKWTNQFIGYSLMGGFGFIMIIDGVRVGHWLGAIIGCVLLVIAMIGSPFSNEVKKDGRKSKAKG